MSRFNIMPRAYRRQLQAADEANVQRAVGAARDDDQTYIATAAGDSRKLRGIPAIGPGVTGAIRDTIPGANLLRSVT